ncbi:unnamed protein product [Closterium sp. NIES-64]|nr:unnamed protein product [Closterium sp. NIES-64]
MALRTEGGCLNKLLEVLVSLDDWQPAHELAAYMLHLAPTHSRARRVLAMSSEVFHPDPVALQAALDALAARASAAAAAAGGENGLDAGPSAGATAGFSAEVAQEQEQEQEPEQQGSALGSSEMSVQQYSPVLELCGRSWAELILNTVHVFRMVQQRSVERQGLEHPQPVAGVSVTVVVAGSLQGGGDPRNGNEGLIEEGVESGRERSNDDEEPQEEQQPQEKSCAAAGPILFERDRSVDMASVHKSWSVEAASEPTALPQLFPASHPSDSSLPDAPFDPPAVLSQPDPSFRVTALSEPNLIAVVDLCMEDSQSPPDATPTPTAELPAASGPPDADDAPPEQTPPIADSPLTQTPLTQTQDTQTAATSADATPMSTQESPAVTPAALAEAASGPAPDASAAAVSASATTSHDTATADAVAPDAVASDAAAPDSAAPAVPAKSRKRHRHPLSFVGTERRTRQQIKEMQLQESKGKESTLLESAKPLPPKRLRVFDILGACFKQQSPLIGACDGDGFGRAGKNGRGKEGLAVGVAEGGVGADAAAAVGADSAHVGSGGGASDGLKMLHRVRRKEVLVRFFSKEEEWSSVDVAAGARAEVDAGVGAGASASEGVKAADGRDPAGDAERLGVVQQVSAAEVEQVQSFLAALPKRLPLLQAASLILQYLASHLALSAFTPSVLDALLWLERQAVSWEGRSPSVWLYLGELYLAREVQSDGGVSRGRQEAVEGAVERECVHCLGMAEQGQMDEEGVRWEVDGDAWGPVGGRRIAPEKAGGEVEELGQGKGHGGLGGWEKVGFWVRLRASQGQVAMRRGEHGRAIELFTWCRDALGRAERSRGCSDGAEVMLPAEAGCGGVAALAHAAVEVPHLASVWGPNGGISVQGLDELLSELHVDCVLAGLSGTGEGVAGQKLPQPPQQQQQLINMMKPLLLRDGAAGMGGGAGRQKGRSYCLPGLASHSSPADGGHGVNADSQHSQQSEQSFGKWLETLKRLVAATRGMAQEQPLALVCYKHILALLSSRISMGALPPAPAKATPVASAALEGSAAAAGKASAGGGKSDAGASCEAELMQTVPGLRDLTASMALGTGLDSQVNEQHLEELQQVVAVLIDFAFYKHRLLQEQPASQLSREVYQPGLSAAAARSGILAAWQGMVVAWQGLLVDLCMALCCLQHLRVSVNTIDKVAMWAITHSILASQGLCCAAASPSSSSAADVPPSTMPNTASAPVSAASSCRQSGNGSTAAAEDGTPAAVRAPSGRGAFLALSAQLLTNLESLLTPSVHAGGRKAKAAAGGGKEPRVRGLKGGRGGDGKAGVGGVGANGGSSARDVQRTGGNGGVSAGEMVDGTAGRVGNTAGVGRASMGTNGERVSCSGQGEQVEDTHAKRCALEEIEGAMDQCFLCLYGVQLRGAEVDVGGESSGGGAGQEAAAAGQVQHQNTLAGDLKSKDHCARALRHMAPFVASFTIERLVKLVPLLTSIHSLFPSPPPAILAHHSVEPFLDDSQINDWGMVERIVLEGKRLGEEGKVRGGHTMQADGGTEEGRRRMENREGAFGVKGKELTSDGGEQLNHASMLNTMPDLSPYIPVLRPHSFLSEWTSSRHPASLHADPSHAMNSDTYADVYNPLFAMLARIEPIPMGHHMPPGFFLEPKGHSHVLQVTAPLLADLCYHPSNTDSWLKLALFYDEASDLMLNDGAKMKGPADWHAEEGVLRRLQGYRQRCTRCLVEAIATPGCRLPFEVAALEESDSRWEGWTGREGRKVWVGRKGSEAWEGCEEQRKRVVSVLELLAFVVYDSIQNVVPSYDRLRHTQVRDGLWLNRCRLAFQLFRILQSLSYVAPVAHKFIIALLLNLARLSPHPPLALSTLPNWQYPFFQGKLAEKLHLPASLALSLMRRSVSLRPNAVDTAYRLHASRLKALARSRVEAGLSDDAIRALVSNSDTKDALARILQQKELEAQPGGGATAAEGSTARDTGHVSTADGAERKRGRGEDEVVEGRGEAEGEKVVERAVVEGSGVDKGLSGERDGSDEVLEVGRGVAEGREVGKETEGEKDGSHEVLEVESSKEGREGAKQEEETDERKDGDTEEDKEGGKQKGGSRGREMENEEEGSAGDADGDADGGDAGDADGDADGGDAGGADGDADGGDAGGADGDGGIGGGDGGGRGESGGEGEDDDDDVVLVEPTQVESTQVDSTQDSGSVKKRKGGEFSSGAGKKHLRLAEEGEPRRAEQGGAASEEASRAAAETAVQSEEHGAGIADLKKQKQQAEEGESEQLEQQGKKQHAPVADVQQLRQHWPLVWQHLFQESEKGVRECLEGDFKHFHRGRYCLAKAYLRRGEPGDLERAKSELGFCFRKAKVAFAMNMWEICIHTKHAPRPKGGSKGARLRRKVVGLASVEVAESSRKFMTCVRVYLMMYLRLCCYTGDVAALEGALSTLKTDKEFSTALVDLVPLALALFVLSLHASAHPSSEKTTQQHTSAALGIGPSTSAMPTTVPGPVPDVATSAIPAPSVAVPPESSAAAVAGAAEAAASCAAPPAAVSPGADASPTAATVHVLGLAAPGASTAAAAGGAADGASACLRRAEGEPGNEPAEASVGDRLMTLYLDNVFIWGEAAEVLRLSRAAYVETVTRGGEDRTGDKDDAAAQHLAWEEEQERSWFDMTEWHVLSALKLYAQKGDLDFFASAAAKIRARAPSPSPPPCPPAPSCPLPKHPVTPCNTSNPTQTCITQTTPSQDASQPSLPFSSLPPSAIHHTPSAPSSLLLHDLPDLPFPSSTSHPSTLPSFSPLRRGAAFAQRMHLHTMLCWSHALLGALSDILPVSAWPLFPWLHPLSLSDLPSATPPLLCKEAGVTKKEEDDNGGPGLMEGECLEGTEEDSVGGSDSEDSVLNLISDDDVEEEEEEEDEVDEEVKDEAKEAEEDGKRGGEKCVDKTGVGGQVCEGGEGKEGVDQPSTPATVGVETGAAGPVPVMTRGGLRVTIPLLQGQTLMQPAPYPSSASDATAPLHNPMQSRSPLALPSSTSTKAFGAISATGAPAAGSAAASVPSTPSYAPSFPGNPICTTFSPSPFSAGPPSSPFPSLTPPRVNLLLLKAKASESDADRALALLRSAQALEREASGELPFGKVLGGGKKGGVSGGGGALGMKWMKAAAREGAGSGVRVEVLGRSVGGGGGGEAGQGMQVTGTSFVENRKAGEVVEHLGGGAVPQEGRCNEEEEVEEWRTRLHGLSTQLLEVAYALVHGRSLAALAAAEQAQAQMKVQAEEQARAEELAEGGKQSQGGTALNGEESEGQQALVPGTETEAKVTTATAPKSPTAAGSSAAVSASVVTSACSPARRMEQRPSPCRVRSTDAQALFATAASPSAAVSRAVPAQTAAASAAAAASPSRSLVPDAAEERLPASSHPPKFPSCSPTGAAPILKPPLARLPKLARRFQAGLKRKQTEGEDVGQSTFSEGHSVGCNGDGVNEADKRRTGDHEAAAATEASTGAAAEAAVYEGVVNGWTGCSRTDGVRYAPSAAITGSSAKGKQKEDRNEKRGSFGKGRKVVDGSGEGCERVDVEGGEQQVRRMEDEVQVDGNGSEKVVLQQNVRLEERRQHGVRELGVVMAPAGEASEEEMYGEEEWDGEEEEDGKVIEWRIKRDGKRGAEHCKSSSGGRRDGGEIVRKRKAGGAVDGKAAPLRQGSRPALSLQNDAGKAVPEGKKQLAAVATSAQEASPSTGPSLSRSVKPTSKPSVKPLARPPAKPPSMAAVKAGLQPGLKTKQTQKTASTPAAPSIHESLSMSHSALQMHQGTPSTSHQGPNRGARQGTSVQKKAVMAVAGAVHKDTGGNSGKLGGQEAGTSGVVRKSAGGGEQTAGVSVSGEVGAKSMRAVLKRKRAVVVADESARRIAAPDVSADAAVGGADEDAPAPTPATIAAAATVATAAAARPAAVAGPDVVDAKASQAKKATANRVAQRRQSAPPALAHAQFEAPPAVVKEVKVVIPVKSAIAVKKRNVAGEGTISDRTGTVGAASVGKGVGGVGTSNLPASGHGSTGKGSAKLLARKTAAVKREPITNTPEETDARSGQGVQAAAAKVALSGPGKGAAGSVAMGGTGIGPVKKRKLGEGKDRGSVVKLLEQQMEGVAAQREGTVPAFKAGTATSKAGVSQTTLADAANPSDPGVATGAASAVGVGGRGQKKGVNPGGKGSLKVVQIGAPQNIPKLKLGSSAPKGGTKAAAVTVGPVSVDKAGSGRSNQVSQKGISKKGVKGKTLANSGAAQMEGGVPGVTDEVGTCTDVTGEATGEKCTQDPAPQGKATSATIGSPGGTKVPATQRKKQPLVIKIQKPRHAVAVEGSSLSKDHDLE